MCDFSACEKGSRPVRASSDTRAAPNTCRRIHCQLCIRLRDGHCVSFRHGSVASRYVTARLDDSIKGTTINHQIPDYGKRFRPPGFDENRIALLEVPHVQLTRRSRSLWSMRDTIDHHAAGTADPLPAIVIECDRFLTHLVQVPVDDVQHLEKRHVGIDVFRLVTNHLTLSVRVLLSPDMKRQVHYL